jgi:hypothetical protein
MNSPIAVTRGDGTPAPMPEMKTIEFAPSDECQRYALEVDEVLEACGHPEAWVTDESQVGDMITTEGAQKAARKLGIGVREADYIWEVAKRLRETRRPL